MKIYVNFCRRKVDNKKSSDKLSLVKILRRDFFMKKLSIYEMTTCAIMTALMCVLGPLSIPIGPIPVSLTNFVLYVTIILLGTKLTLVSYIVYLLLALVGLPVLSGYSGGVAKLAGPTGGYLLGFIFLIIIGGIFYEKFKSKHVIVGIGLFIGLLAAYFFGTIWFVYQMSVDIPYALSVCVFPFIPFDIVKIVIAIILGNILKNALNKSGLINK